LHLSDGAITLGSALFYMAMLLISLRLSKLSERFGHRNILVYSGVVYCFYPLLNGLARDATIFRVASLVGGGVWALANGGLINRLMERVPERDRPAHMALHNVALNLGILSG
jgi:MFS family permease